MRLISRFLIVAILIVGLLAAASYLLPRRYFVERKVEINAPAEKVFPYVADLREWPKWTIWEDQDPAMVTTYSDDTTGVGATSRWNGPEAGTGEMEVTTHEPPIRIVYKLRFDEFNMESVGQVVLSETRDSTVVTWSDSGDLGMNPLNRWFGLTLDKLIGKDFEEGLARLRVLVEATGDKAAGN